MAFFNKKLPDPSETIPYKGSFFAFHVLSETEYNTHINRWASSKCLKSKNKLILGFLPLVNKISKIKSKINNVLSIEDIFSSGVCGLITAIDKFNPEFNARLGTYAQWWINSSINQFIKDNWSQVKICTTETQRKLYSNYNKAIKNLKLENKELLNDVDLAKISKELKINLNEVKNFQIRFQKDLGVGEIEEFNKLNIDYNIIENSCFEKNVINNQNNLFQKKSIKNSMSVLTDKEKKIINLRYFNEKECTRESIGKIFGISDERVRQIENNAKSKILNFFKKNNLEKDLKITCDFF